MRKHRLSDWISLGVPLAWHCARLSRSRRRHPALVKDVHRGPTLVVSPYVRRHALDSTMYSTASVLRTMEAILGLPAMTQYDAAATPMWASFQAKPDARPFAGLAAQVDLGEMNTSRAYGAQRSIELGLEVADTADDREYNEIIWKAVKGAGSSFPPRRVASFVACT